MLDDEQILKKTTALLDILQEKCWDGYKQVGLKKKGDRMVPNCVPVREELGFGEGEPPKDPKSKEFYKKSVGMATSRSV